MFSTMTKALKEMKCSALSAVKRTLSSTSGQGTTEYAILVGVLVVIAIVAIIAFKDKVSELWQSIADGINTL